MKETSFTCGHSDNCLLFEELRENDHRRVPAVFRCGWLAQKDQFAPHNRRAPPAYHSQRKTINPPTKQILTPIDTTEFDYNFLFKFTLPTRLYTLAWEKIKIIRVPVISKTIALLAHYTDVYSSWRFFLLGR